jgi:hypothetical protein
MFTPCIVVVSVWNDRLCVERACSYGDDAAFCELLSVSHETFTLASFVKLYQATRLQEGEQLPHDTYMPCRMR